LGGGGEKDRATGNGAKKRNAFQTVQKTWTKARLKETQRGKNSMRWSNCERKMAWLCLVLRSQRKHVKGQGMGKEGERDSWGKGQMRGKKTPQRCCCAQTDHEGDGPKAAWKIMGNRNGEEYKNVKSLCRVREKENGGKTKPLGKGVHIQNPHTNMGGRGKFKIHEQGGADTATDSFLVIEMRERKSEQKKKVFGDTIWGPFRGGWGAFFTQGAWSSNATPKRGKKGNMREIPIKGGGNRQNEKKFFTRKQPSAQRRGKINQDHKRDKHL